MSSIPLKQCLKCGQYKPATDQYFGHNKNGNLTSPCRECIRRHKKESRSKPEYKAMILAQSRTPEGKARNRVYNQRYRNNPEHKEERRIKKNAAVREWYARKKQVPSFREEINKGKRERYANDPLYRQYTKERTEKSAKRPEAIERRRKTDRENKRRKFHNDPVYREQLRNRRKESYQKPENRRKIITIVGRRRDEKVYGEAALTPQQWEDCLAYFNYECAVCGQREGFWTVLAQDHWKPLSKGGKLTADNVVPLCHIKRDGANCCNNSKSNRDALEWLTEKLGKRKAKKKMAEIEAYFEWVRKKV